MSQIENKITKEIKKLLNLRLEKMPVDQQKIIQFVIKERKTLPHQNKSKQWVQALFARIANDIWSDSKIARDILTKHLKNTEKKEAVYLHAPSFSREYQIFIFFWMKRYGFKKREEYLIFNKKMTGVISPKKEIYKRIRETGLPILLGDIEDGVASEEKMLFDTGDKNSWVVSEDGMMIIGSSRVSFIANYCHYQVSTQISIWRMYHFFRNKNKEYISNQKIETVFKFITYIRIRKSDIKCTKMEKLGFKLKNPDNGKPIDIWDASFVAGTKEEAEVKMIVGSLIKKDRE